MSEQSDQLGSEEARRAYLEQRLAELLPCGDEISLWGKPLYCVKVCDHNTFGSDAKTAAHHWMASERRHEFEKQKRTLTTITHSSGTTVVE